MTNNNISNVFNKLKRDGGLPETFTMGELRKAYKKVSLKYHPDKGGDGETMKQITSVFSRIDKGNTPNDTKFSFNRLQRDLKPIKCVQPTWTNNNLNIAPGSPLSPTIPSNWSENDKQWWRNRMKIRGIRIGPRAKPNNWPNSPKPPPRKNSPIYHSFDKYTYTNRKNVIKMGLYSILVLSAFVYIGRKWILQKFYRVVKTPKPVSAKKKSTCIVKKNRGK